MFLYFLNTHYIIWKDDLLLNLIQTMFRSKQEMNILIRYLGHVMNSEILIASFHQMSFHYRSQFIQNLINLIEVVTEEKNMYYSAILDHLVKQPFSFYFLIVFIEQFYQSSVIKKDEIDEFVYFLKEAEKNITSYDLELFIKI